MKSNVRINPCHNFQYDNMNRVMSRRDVGSETANTTRYLLGPATISLHTSKPDPTIRWRELSAGRQTHRGRL